MKLFAIAFAVLTLNSVASAESLTLQQIAIGQAFEERIGVAVKSVTLSQGLRNGLATAADSWGTEVLMALGSDHTLDGSIRIVSYGAVIELQNGKQLNCTRVTLDESGGTINSVEFLECPF